MTRKVVIESPEPENRKQPLLPAPAGTESSPKESTTKNVMKRNNVISNGNGRSKIGEAVGGTAAVCCCCPCAVVHLLVLAVYRVPTGLCRKAWRKKKMIQKRRLLKKHNKDSALLEGKPNVPIGPKPKGLGLGLGLGAGLGAGLASIQLGDDEDDDDDNDDDDEEGLDGDGVPRSDSLEREMWEEFYRGFWRSPSQKED